MMKFLVRPASEKDLPDLKALASSIKGLTTLPDDEELLQNKVHDSLKAFNPHVRKPGGEAYLFVLEDLETHHVVGVSGIVSKVGGFDPFYTYKIKSEKLESEVLNVNKDVKVLHLHINHNGPTEIGSLMLNAKHRKHGLGKLISLSRFMFMAEFPKRFDKTVISELRGVVNKDGKSPFWECVGRHFFDTDFYKADALTGTGNKEVIASLMPKHPLYLELLPQSAKEVVGEVHDDTKPARKMLEEQGFKFHDEIDIFDAGPTVTTSLKDISTVKNSKKAKVSELTPQDLNQNAYLLSNTKLDFHCIVSDVTEKPDGTVALSEATAQALDIKTGEDLRYVRIK